MAQAPAAQESKTITAHSPPCLNGGSAGIQRILHQLLDGCRQVQDDLAGADAVHCLPVNGLDGRCSRVRAAAAAAGSCHRGGAPRCGWWLFGLL